MAKVNTLTTAIARAVNIIFDIAFDAAAIYRLSGRRTAVAHQGDVKHVASLNPITSPVGLFTEAD